MAARQSLSFDFSEDVPATEPQDDVAAKANAGIDSICGLKYIPSYLSSDAQKDIVEKIDCCDWSEELKRRVQHYGYKYDYKSRRIDPEMYVGKLPPWIDELGRRLFDDNHIKFVPDQVIVNEYQPGQGITPHVDCVPCFEDTIVSLSLLSHCVMDFTQLGTGKSVPVHLEPGSIVVLEKESRHKWKHGIAKRKTDVVDNERIHRSRRISLTFRKVIVDFKSTCDVQENYAVGSGDMRFGPALSHRG